MWNQLYKFIFIAHEQKEIVGRLLAFSIEKLDSVVEAFSEWLKTRRTDECAYFLINRLPPEYKVFIIS